MYRYFFVVLATIIFTHTYLTYNQSEEVETPVVEMEIIIAPPAPIDVDVIDYNELECLALNIYHEARGESVEGQIAVSQVVMNRVSSNRFPNSVCNVVYQAIHSKWWKDTHDKLVPVKYQCQFTWYCDGRSDRPRDMNAWGTALSVAATVMRNEHPDLTDGAMWYHANYVKPEWRYSMVKTSTVGDHIFYAERRY